MSEQETIDITPNYDALFQRFKQAAISALEGFARKSAKTLTRKEVYDFVCTFRIAMGAIKNQKMFEELRDEYDLAADKMFDQVVKEQEL